MMTGGVSQSMGVANPGTRIIVEKQGPLWSAYFSDAPGAMHRGSRFSAAVSRLLESAPERQIWPTMLVADNDASTPGRLEFTIRRTGSAPCPDCHGTGQYVGLTLTEPCRTCGGTGTV